MEKLGYVLLALVAAIYLLVMLVGFIAAWPWGLIGLMALLGFGLLFVKVLVERFKNKEDDHYAKNIDK